MRSSNRSSSDRYTASMTTRSCVTTLMLALVVVPCTIALADSAAGIRWTAPAQWKAEAARPMRAATYSITPAAGDRGVAECVVNYFGPGQGGTIDANVERWKGQILGGDGKPAPAKVSSRIVRGIRITIVDASGSYTGMGGPMAGGAKPVAGYRLVGAIAEGRGGNVFFKLTGPEKTIAAEQSRFEQLLSSIQPE
jgi:hypothetical protein